MAEHLLAEREILQVGNNAEVVYVPPRILFLRDGGGEDDMCMAEEWETGLLEP